MKPSSPLSEKAATSGNYFQFEYDKDYQRLQIQFFDAVDQHNLQEIMVCFPFLLKIKKKLHLNFE